jgi:hypothetical protein
VHPIVELGRTRAKKYVPAAAEALRSAWAVANPFGVVDDCLARKINSLIGGGSRAEVSRGRRSAAFAYNTALRRAAISTAEGPELNGRPPSRAGVFVPTAGSADLLASDGALAVHAKL